MDPTTATKVTSYRPFEHPCVDTVPGDRVEGIVAEVALMPLIRIFVAGFRTRSGLS
jgi:hypothetical protein